MAITKVTTDVITDGAVTAPKLADDSVTSDKLAANSVTAAKIAAGTLTDQVANNSITAAKIPNATALTLDGGVTIDNINIDGTTMALSSGDLTLDVAGDIILDADGGDVKFYDGGTNIGNFVNSSSDFAIEAMVQDKDIIFKGDDGGSGITALTLDMSEAGAATFNSVVNIGTASGTQPSYFHSYLNVQNNASTSSNSSLTITAGSAGYAGLHFGDSDNGRIGQVAYNNSDNALLFTANNSERMRIDSSGKVGIGTDSPAEALEVYATEASGGVELLLTNVGDGGSGTAPYTAIRSRLNPIRNGGEIRFGRDSNYGSASNADSNMQFYTALDDTNTERMRIDSNGKVGIGTTSPLSHLTFESDHWNTGTETGPSIRWNNGITTADSVIQNFEDSNVAPFMIGMNSYIGSGGSIAAFNTSYASSFIYQGASGAVQFGTQSSSTPSIRMSILPSGPVCIGDTTTYSGGHDAVSGLQVTGGGSVVAIKQSQVNDASHRVVAVFTDSGGTYRGRITINNSACSFTSASDYRLKENIETLPNGLDRLKQLKPVKFKWKEHDYTSEGFIAHEVQEIYPDAVVGAKDDAVMQSMDYGKITPLLVKAIQELEARVKDLEG